MPTVYNEVFIEHPATAVASIRAGGVVVKLAFSLEKPVLHARFKSCGDGVVIEVPSNLTSLFEKALDRVPEYLRRRLKPKILSSVELKGYSMNEFDYQSTLTAGLVCISSRTPLPIESVLSASSPKAIVSFRSMVMGGLSMYAVLGDYALTPTYHTPPPPNTEVALCRGDYHGGEAKDAGGGIEALRAALSLVWDGRVSEAIEALRLASKSIKTTGKVGLEAADRGVLFIPLEQNGWYATLLFKEDVCSEDTLSYNNSVLEVIENAGLEATVTRLSLGGVIRVS